MIYFLRRDGDKLTTSTATAFYSLTVQLPWLSYIFPNGSPKKLKPRTLLKAFMIVSRNVSCRRHNRSWYINFYARGWMRVTAAKRKGKLLPQTVNIFRVSLLSYNNSEDISVCFCYIESSMANWFTDIKSHIWFTRCVFICYNNPYSSCSEEDLAPKRRRKGWGYGVCAPHVESRNRKRERER